jgi:hypothetical protein
MNKDEESSGAEAIRCVVLQTLDAKIGNLDLLALQTINLVFALP